MSSRTFNRSAIAALALVMAMAWSAPVGAQPSLTDGFGPVVPRVENRPAMLMETDYYVYGPGTGFTDPDVMLTSQSNDFGNLATLYVYHHDRVSNTRLFFNTTLGMTALEVDVYGLPGAPARIVAPDLDDFKVFGAGGAFGPVPDLIPVVTGRYQWVVELRNGNGSRVISRANGFYNQVDGVVTVGGEQGSQTWNNRNVYFLESPVNISGGNLRIQPGTVVLGSQAGQGTLVIEQGASIEAQGGPLDPIIFTSELPVGERGPGNWGGLVINGRAPTNQGLDPLPEGEGDSGPYGGTNPNDSSGVLSYARVEFAGIRFSEQNELNGIAAQGVGRQTQLDHIQVHQNQDDGIEFFGGTADAKYVLITGAEDDSLDWTFGWRGRLQYFVAIQCGLGEQDNGIEADNFESNETQTPISDPEIRNATWAGDADILPDASDDGILLRRGTRATIANAVVHKFTTEGINIDGDGSNSWLNGNGIDIADTIVFGNNPNSNVSLASLGGPIYEEDPGFYNDPLGRAGCGVTPDITFANRHDEGSRGGGNFFDRASFIGAVDDDDPWIDDGWATFSDN